MKKLGCLMIFCLAGCTTTHWNKPDMTLAQFEIDRDQCEANAKLDFPVVLSNVSTGNCVSTPAYRCPYRGDPASYSMYQGVSDENGGKRLLAVNACLSEKGYKLTTNH